MRYLHRHKRPELTCLGQSRTINEEVLPYQGNIVLIATIETYQKEGLMHHHIVHGYVLEYEKNITNTLKASIVKSTPFSHREGLEAKLHEIGFGGRILFR